MAREIEDLIQQAMQESEDNHSKEVNFPPLPEKKTNQEKQKNSSHHREVTLPPLPSLKRKEFGIRAVAGPAVEDPQNSRQKQIQRLDHHTLEQPGTNRVFQTPSTPSVHHSSAQSAHKESLQVRQIRHTPESEYAAEPERPAPKRQTASTSKTHAKSSCSLTSVQRQRMRQMQAGEKFYHYLLRIVIVTIGICAVGLGYLYIWLQRYEKRSINGAMTNYMYAVQNHKWDRIYKDDTTYFTELNSQEGMQAYLLTLYGNVKAGGTTFAWVETNEETGMRYYDVYYQGNKVGTLECVKPEGSEEWKVRTVVTGGTYTVDVIGRADFTVNGYDVEDSLPSEGGHIPWFAEGMGIDNLMPETTRYTIENLVSPPVLSTTSSNDVIVRDYSGNHFYIGPQADSESMEEFKETTQETAEAYSKFISEDGTLYNLLSYLYPNTNFYTAMKGFNNQYFSTHNSIEFLNMEIDEIMPFGDYAFFSTISFDFHVTSDTTERTSPTKYQIHYVKSNGQWLATNIITVSSDKEFSEEDNS